MWLIVRLAAVGLGMLWRLKAQVRPRMTKRVGELEYAERFVRGKYGRVISHSLGVPCDPGPVVMLSPEGRWDRWFKRMGFSEEFQTGDDEFDRRVYVSCDGEALHDVLRRDAEVRAKVVALLGEEGGVRIRADGKFLWVKCPREVQPPRVVPMLAALAGRLTNASGHLPRWWADPFAVRALAVEFVLWGIAGYAVGAFLGALAHEEDYHVWPATVVWWGVMAGFAFVALLLGVLCVIFRGSSRGHRLIAEGALLLVLSLPVACTQGVADVNRSGRPDLVTMVDARIDTKRIQLGGPKKRTRQYMISLRTEDGSAIFPAETQVTGAVYRSVQVGQRARVELARGRLGLDWYVSINGVKVGE